MTTPIWQGPHRDPTGAQIAVTEYGAIQHEFRIHPDSLRDLFAGMAMQTLLQSALYSVELTHDEGDPIETVTQMERDGCQISGPICAERSWEIALAAYAVADALIEARKKEKE